VTALLMFRQLPREHRTGIRKYDKVAGMFVVNGIEECWKIVCHG